MLVATFTNKSHVHSTVAALAAAALLLVCSQGRTTERNPSRAKESGGRTSKSAPAPLATMPGKVRLPTGRTYCVQLHVLDRQDETFTGTLTYDLGLRQQSFDVEGTFDEKGGLFFHETAGKHTGQVHPHSPVLGGGKFETTKRDEYGMSGVAYLRLARGATIETVETAARCEFTFGARALLKNNW